MALIHDTVKILAHTPHWLLEVVPVDRMACITRSAAPFESIDQLTTSFRTINNALDRLGRGRHVLLVDLREGPFRALDEAAQTRYHEQRRLMIHSFPVVAVVTKTAVGRLQVMRHAHEDQMPVKVFDDIEAARAHLRRYFDGRSRG